MKKQLNASSGNDPLRIDPVVTLQQPIVLDVRCKYGRRLYDLETFHKDTKLIRFGIIALEKRDKK